MPDSDTETLKFLDWICKRYGHFDSFSLSEMTHQKGTPWQIMAQKHNYRVPFGLEIDDEITTAYFKDLAKKENIRLN